MAVLVCTIIAARGLYVCIVPSPKREVLRRDGRYALHCYPPEEVDDAFCVTGWASEERDSAVRAEVAATYHDSLNEQWSLFALDIKRCLHAKYRRGAWPPKYAKWIAPEQARARKRTQV